MQKREETAPCAPDTGYGLAAADIGASSSIKQLTKAKTLRCDMPARRSAQTDSTKKFAVA